MWRYLYPTIVNNFFDDIEVWYNDGIFIISTLFKWIMYSFYYFVIGSKYITTSLYNFYTEKDIEKVTIINDYDALQFFIQTLNKPNTDEENII